MSAWKEYKAKLEAQGVKPWDFLNPNTEYASEELSNSRYETCLGCERFINLTKQCKECGCFMVVKTKLKNATCPLEKW